MKSQIDEEGEEKDEYDIEEKQIDRHTNLGRKRTGKQKSRSHLPVQLKRIYDLKSYSVNEEMRIHSWKREER